MRWRSAATLILTATTDVSGASAPRVLMAQRHARARFMPNAWVFPGGALDAHADVAAATDLCTAAHAPLQRTSLSLYDDVAQQLHIDTAIGEPASSGVTSVCIARIIRGVTSVHEPRWLRIRWSHIHTSFDLARAHRRLGLLAVYDQRRSRVAVYGVGDADAGRQLCTLMHDHPPAAVRADPSVFVRLVRGMHEHSLPQMTEWSDWLTPIGESKTHRFDTVFYIVHVTTDKLPPVDAFCQVELQAAQWVDAYDTLRRCFTSTTDRLPPPQIYELSRVCTLTCAQLQQAIDVRTNADVNPTSRLCPQLMFTGDGVRMAVLNGDSLYETTSDETQVGIRRVAEPYSQLDRSCQHRMLFAGADWTQWSLHVDSSICTRFGYATQPITVPSPQPAAS